VPVRLNEFLFQAKFWKLRQNLYEPYLLQYRPLQIRQARYPRCDVFRNGGNLPS